MSTEQEARKARLADEFFRILGRFSPGDRTDQSMALAARALELGADLPPEPECEPGQLVTLAVGASGPPTHVGYRRRSGGWHIFSDGYDTVISDETARNVEPVAVLTAEDARGVAERVAQRMVASGISDGPWAQVAGEAVEDEFRERGLDL